VAAAMALVRRPWLRSYKSTTISPRRRNRRRDRRSYSWVSGTGSSSLASRIPPFVATLSGFLAYRGLALLLWSARPLADGDDFAFLGGRISP